MFQNSGNETEAASALSMVDSPSPASAATANAMAMRWSPKESNAAARNFCLPGTRMPSGVDFDLDAHAAEVLRNGGDAVGLLDAQLLRVADHEPFFGGRAQHGEHRDFVDQRRRQLLVDRAAAHRRVPHLDIADQFAVDRFDRSAP